MKAASVVMLVSPLAEAGAAKLTTVAEGGVGGLGTSVKTEGVVRGVAKVGEAGGLGAGKPFSNSVKDAARAESGNSCVFCGKETGTTPGPTQSNIDHAIPKSRGGNNSMETAHNAYRTAGHVTLTRAPRPRRVSRGTLPTIRRELRLHYVQT